MRNDQAVVQTFPSLSAILDFIALIHREAPRSALVNHMVQHNISPQTYQQILSQQNITQPVFFSNPVTIFTGIVGCEAIGFSLDRVGSLLVRHSCKLSVSCKRLTLPRSSSSIWRTPRETCSKKDSKLGAQRNSSKGSSYSKMRTSTCSAYGRLGKAS